MRDGYTCKEKENDVIQSGIGLFKHFADGHIIMNPADGLPEQTGNAELGDFWTPLPFRTEWNTVGDDNFVNRRFRQALDGRATEDGMGRTGKNPAGRPRV